MNEVIALGDGEDTIISFEVHFDHDDSAEILNTLKEMNSEKSREVQFKVDLNVATITGNFLEVALFITENELIA